jgi:uncharacterized repeat protein (TIGR01451 family)
MSAGVRRVRAMCVAFAAAGGVCLASPLSAAADGWSVVPTPNAGTTDNLLLGISCAGGTGCVAVGSHLDANGIYRTLVLRDTGGGWTVVASPNVGTGDNLLQGVHCLEGGGCWAVGYYVDASGVQHGLIERDTGSGWTLVSSPASSTRPDVLYSVTCAGAALCWAVGYHPYRPDVGIYTTLIEKNTGSGWAIVGSPNPGTSYNVLQGVSCTSGTDCSAVGYTASSLASRTLIEHFGGSGWSAIASPNTSASQNNQLNGVSCQADGSCWAVGLYDANGTGAFRTLIERNTGAGWGIVSSPNVSGVSNVLQGVACADGDCWAVGWYFSGQYQALIEHWTGSGWSIVASPPAGTGGNLLNGVSCAGASGCTAAGYLHGQRATQTLIEHSSSTAGADLLMNLRAASTSTVGSDLTYRLHITNRGPQDAAVLSVHFSLPLGTTFIGASDGGQLDSNQDSVRWHLPGVVAGQKLVLTVTLRMDVAKSMRAFASVHAATFDPNPAYDKSSVLTYVSARANSWPPRRHGPRLGGQEHRDHHGNDLRPCSSDPEGGQGSESCLM